MRNTVVEITDPSGASIRLIENIPHRWRKELSIQSKDPGDIHRTRYSAHAKIKTPEMQADTIRKMRILAEEFSDVIDTAPFNDRREYTPSTVPEETCMDYVFRILSENGTNTITLFGVKIQDPEMVLNTLADALESVD